MKTSPPPLYCKSAPSALLSNGKGRGVRRLVFRLLSAASRSSSNPSDVALRDLLVHREDQGHHLVHVGKGPEEPHADRGNPHHHHGKFLRLRKLDVRRLLRNEGDRHESADHTQPKEDAGARDEPRSEDPKRHDDLVYSESDAASLAVKEDERRQRRKKWVIDPAPTNNPKNRGVWANGSR